MRRLIAFFTSLRRLIAFFTSLRRLLAFFTSLRRLLAFFTSLRRLYNSVSDPYHFDADPDHFCIRFKSLNDVVFVVVILSLLFDYIKQNK